MIHKQLDSALYLTEKDNMHIYLQVIYSLHQEDRWEAAIPINTRCENKTLNSKVK
jgi:hypothetical protein